MNFKKIIIAGLVLVPIFLVANDLTAYKELVKEEVKELNKNIVKKINDEIYIDSIKYENDTVIYYYIANMKKLYKKGDKIVPWEKDSEAMYPQLKQTLKHGLGSMVIRKFSQNMCFNHDSRYIIKRGIPLRMRLSWKDSGEFVAGARLDEKTCLIYDKFNNDNRKF